MELVVNLQISRGVVWGSDLMRRGGWEIRCLFLCLRGARESAVVVRVLSLGCVTFVTEECRLPGGRSFVELARGAVGRTLASGAFQRPDRTGCGVQKEGKSLSTAKDVG